MRTARDPGTTVERPTATGGATHRVMSTQERFEARARSERRRTLTIVATVVAVLALVAAGVWAVGFSSLLTTTTVSVSGARDDAQATEIESAAKVPLGGPLARADLGAIQDRVAAVATVSQVEVSRRWPHTIDIAVVQKVPVLAVRNAQGQLQVVDSNGNPYEVVEAAPAGVPTVSSTEASVSAEGMRAAIEVLTVLPADLRGQVGAITVSGANLVSFTLGKVNVVWGGEKDGAKKVVVLKALLGTQPGTIDVSAPDTPVTR